MLLIFPPQAPVFSPHLALPQLSGFLKAAGKSVDIIDLNALFYDYLFKDFALRHYNGNTLKAIDILRGKQFYELTEYECSCQFILWALEIEKKVCGFKNKLLDADYGVDVNSSLDIIKNLNNFDNVFYPIFNKLLTNNICMNKLIGISVSYSTQLIPALPLCRYIRNMNSKLKIVLGGSHVTSIAENLNKSDLRMYFDFLVCGPGEIPLLELCDKIESQFNSCKTSFETNKELCADWSTITGYRYLSPEIILPISFSKGCYWGKCSFCNHEILQGDKYILMSVDTAVKNIRKTMQQTGTRFFTFVDSVLPIAWLEKLSDALKGSGIIWDACVRFDSGKFDFTKLYNGGCRLLRFGLESGSQSILNLMNKGINLNNVAEMLKKCFESGIGTFVFFFTGFPGETKDNAYETLYFIKRNAKYINFANGGNTFYLGIGSPVYLNPIKYGIEIVNDNNRDLSLGASYISHNGMEKEEIAFMAKVQHIEIKKLFKEEGILNQIYDMHDLLYAAHYGSKGLKRMILEKA